METQMNIAMASGLAILGLGFLGALVALVMLVSSPDRQGVLKPLLATAALACAGFFAGAWLGALYFCSPADAGNLCGLGGVFGTGPLGAGLGLAAGALVMYRARQAR